jgi:hypothetical protein
MLRLDQDMVAMAQSYRAAVSEVRMPTLPTPSPLTVKHRPSWRVYGFSACIFAILLYIRYVILVRNEMA